MTEFTNRTFTEIAPGEQASVTHVVTATDLEMLAFVGGDVGPHQVGGADATPGAQGATAIVMIASLLNRRLPGPGTTIVASRMQYGGTIAVGDELVATVVATAKHADGNRIDFDCRCVNQREELLLQGAMSVQAPTDRLEYSDFAQPGSILRRSDEFAKLLQRCKGMPAVVCAVVHPCERNALLGALEAARHGLIVPVLVGPEAKIRATALAAGADISDVRIVSTEHSHAAASAAVAMARSGEVGALMKGSLHTDELMAAVVDADKGLRTARRISHVFVIDVPTYPRLLLVTDAAINVFPTLADKMDIAQNAIDLARTLGIATPRLAVLSAMETVNPKLESTLHAAALCKMADRGQITGGIVDGPLAFDNAISERAARAKGIVSEVAGRADILLVPDLEAGNMMAKQLQYLAGADAAGIVLGARVPIVLTSRADSIRARLASTAVMQLVAHAKRAAASAAATFAQDG